MSKFGMVMDITRCSGCQTCVITCQMNNNQRPQVAWSAVETVEEGEWPDGDRFALPHACMHCQDAPCVQVCPNGSSAIREDGIVTIDYETCIACGACVTACPYDARSINSNDKWYFDAEEPAPYEAYGTPHFGVAEKCTFCSERVDDGLLPCCVEACPNVARIFGDIDDPESEISTYISESGAEILEGTSVYYVKGDRDVSISGLLLGDDSASTPVSSGQPEGQEPKEEQNPNIAVIGLGGTAVAAAAAVGIGFAVKNSRNKKNSAVEAGGKDDE